MNKPRKIVNRYYVAHPKMGDALNQTAGLEGSHRRGLDRRQWAQPTLEAAIEHAREILENNEDNQQECLIVKIVKRVRRKTAPVIVEDVRGS